MEKKFITKLLVVMLCIVVTATMFGCKKDVDNSGNDAAKSNSVIKTLPEVVIATMVIADYGVVKMELYPSIAPQTVYNFIYLASSGYYDGLIIHRVSKNFLVQTGAYEEGYVLRTANSPDELPYTILGEFANNNVDNTLSHKKGVVSMFRDANGEDSYNSACSEFFICMDTSTSYTLDGDYAAFATVVEGMDIIEDIAKVDCYNERPIDDIIITSLSVETTADFPLPNFLPLSGEGE